MGIIDFRELWRFRELLIALTIREIKVRYKQTLLGALWAILQPLALTVIFTVIFGFFLHVRSEPVPFPIFAYSALLPWTFFATAVSFGSLSVVNNGNLVSKIYFPRVILPLSTIGAAFFDLAIASIIFLFMLAFYKLNVTFNILFILMIVPAIFLLTTGIAFILSSLNVLFRDIRFVIPLVLQVWLYLTPVIYSMDQIPDRFHKFYILNPLAPLIEGFRDVTVFGRTPDIFFLLVSVIMSVIIFVFGYMFFKSREKIFADVI